jgi:hypothetical protein
MSTKQAVLLIHGIGEQRPMDTLRSFVQSVWTTDTTLHKQHPNANAVWSKPYQLSENFELRRLTTPENAAGIRTDFFELYWAHLMSGNKLIHVLAWLRTLLWRSPSTVPRHLTLAYWTLWILVLFGFFLAYEIAMVTSKDGPHMPIWLSLLLSVFVLPVVYGVLENIVGDAARYLDATPQNIQRRHEIRAAGLATLKSLHEKEYDRIIVVGHSLGTVIGYDILSYAWSIYNTKAPVGTSPSFASLEALERMAQDAISTEEAGAPVLFHHAQRRYQNELKANGNEWRVTDFISMGSPLAHSEILLARNAADLSTKFESRELSKSPPTLESTRRDHELLLRFTYPVDQPNRVPHHAAVFGPTRWTNLYFPNRLLIVGDLVGGSVHKLFGPGVKDIAVNTKLWNGLLSHTFYWTQDSRSDTHILALREALDLLDHNAG